MKHTTIHDALKYVAEHPEMETDEVTQIRTHELIARTLYEISNKGDGSVRGSLSRANKARKMILDRLVGKRRPGSHPATREKVPLTFIDLTGEEIEK